MNRLTLSKKLLFPLLLATLATSPALFAVDSTAIAPNSTNSGVPTTAGAKNLTWMRSVDRTASGCYTNGDSASYNPTTHTGDGSGYEVFDAHFSDSNSDANEVDSEARCAKGYEAIGAYFYSIVSTTATGISRLRLYGGTRCCPIKWYILDQSITNPTTTTISNPTSSGQPPNAATPDLN